VRKNPRFSRSGDHIFVRQQGDLKELSCSAV
jgi:hypothetical protein